MLFIIYLFYTNHYIQYEYNMALHFFVFLLASSNQYIGALENYTKISQTWSAMFSNSRI